MVKKTASKTSAKPSRSANKPQEGSQNAQSGRFSTAQNIRHQQKVLGIFQAAFDSLISSGKFLAILQEVKSALFNRDFDKAFGNEEYLEAYAARWSPTRALCYTSILNEIGPHLDELCGREADGGDGDGDEAGEAGDAGEAGPAANNLKVVAIGGAAAEIVALGYFLRQQQQQQGPSLSGSITLLDVAPWADAVEKLRVSLTTPPPLSKYASAAQQAANTALVDPERLAGVTFRQADVLSLTQEEVSSLVGPGPGPAEPVLVTLLFTLNELFTAGGIGKTTSFLLSLTGAVPAGSLLLVVDSPGSYSEATLGKDAKRYPMQWLLDKVLLGTTEGAWEKVESQDSAWFRLPPRGLKYPIPLEDMRYQMHLYRASGTNNAG